MFDLQDLKGELDELRQQKIQIEDFRRDNPEDPYDLLSPYRVICGRITELQDLLSNAKYRLM